MSAVHIELPGAEASWVRRLLRSEYDQLVGAGAFHDERVELIRGVIVRMPPHGPLHASPIQRLTHLLLPRVGDRAHVRVQLPLNAPDESEPEPDIALVAPGDYDDAHPSNAFLVIEVAETSLRFDRATKGPLYAAMGVPEYWIVNVRESVIEVHRDPAGEHYRDTRAARRGESITLEQFPDVSVEVSSILRR